MFSRVIIFLFATFSLSAASPGLEFALAVSKAMESRDAATLNRLFDMEKLIKHVMRGYEDETEFNEGFRKGVSSQGGGAMLLQAAPEGSTVRHLKIIPGKSPRVLLRILTPDGLVVYLELALSGTTDLRAHDFYNHAGGISLSHQMRRMYLMALNSTKPNANATSTAFMQSIQSMMAMRQRTTAGDFQGAHSIFNGLPQKIREEKLFMIMDIAISQNRANEALYTAAIARFLKKYPKDVAANMQSIDYYSLKEDYPRVLAAIDKVSQTVGHDPYLNVLRANAYAGAGDLSKAITACHDARKSEPNLAPAWDTMLTLYARKGDQANALEALLGLEKIMEPSDLNHLANDPDFTALVRSDAYRNYRQKYPLQ